MGCCREQGRRSPQWGLMALMEDTDRTCGQSRMRVMKRDAGVQWVYGGLHLGDQKRRPRDTTFNPGFRGGRPQLPEHPKTLPFSDTLLLSDFHTLKKKSSHSFYCHTDVKIKWKGILSLRTITAYTKHFPICSSLASWAGLGIYRTVFGTCNAISPGGYKTGAIAPFLWWDRNTCSRGCKNKPGF